MTTIELPVVLVLGRDHVGVIAESDGMRYYLTNCCGASAKGMSNYTGCRACYQPIDPRLGEVPGKRMDVVALFEKRYDDLFVDQPIDWVEIYGDGLPYDTWKASR